MLEKLLSIPKNGRFETLSRFDMNILKDFSYEVKNHQQNDLLQHAPGEGGRPQAVCRIKKYLLVTVNTIERFLSPNWDC